DLARWLEAQLNDGRVDGRQVFPPGVIAATHQPLARVERPDRGPISDTAYGLGWVLGRLHEHAAVYHGGGYTGAHAFVSFDPARRVGVAVLANEENVSQLLAALVSGFTYDWWAGEADARALMDQRATEWRGMVEAYHRRTAEDRARRAERTWQLTLPLAAYTGTYTNALYGTLVVSAEGDVPVFQSGNLRAVGAPFTEPNTARVELIPGQGSVIAFEVTDGRVPSLRYDDVVFERVPDSGGD
ncbi:MAG TPA: serine hydrolase, partial [Rubricoccaceae bacterium]|nr:serine hydrolase [Rubricoccaceae bacterium]